MKPERRKELSDQLMYSSALIQAMAESFKSESVTPDATQYVERIHQRAKQIISDGKKELHN